MKKNDFDEIIQLRERIDGIDEQLVELLNERFKNCVEIAKIKKVSGLSVIDVSRQLEILNKVKFLSLDSFEQVNYLIFSVIIRMSVNLQKEAKG